MPRLSQWIIRTAFIYLLLGFTFGALLLAHKGVPLHPALWSWLPAHIEFLLMGWIVQPLPNAKVESCIVTHIVIVNAMALSESARLAWTLKQSHCLASLKKHLAANE